MTERVCLIQESVNEWMNEQTNERLNEWTNELTNEWMNEQTKQRTNEWTNKWMNERKSSNVNKCWKTCAKGNDIITNVISANQHFASTVSMQMLKFQRGSCKLSFLFPPRRACSQVSVNWLVWSYFITFLGLHQSIWRKFERAQFWQNSVVSIWIWCSRRY